MKTTIIVLTILSLMFACKPTEPIEKEKVAPPKQEIKQDVWKLVKSNITFSERVTSRATIQINTDENTVSGTTGCNTYRGAYQLEDNNNISFRIPFMLTKMYCEDAKDENVFVDELQKCDRMEIKKNILVFSQNGVILLQFEKQ